MEFVYPALFHKNEDGTYTITYPDLDGCISEGKSLANAMHMAQDALTQWIEYTHDSNRALPVPSNLNAIKSGDHEFVNLICADIRDNRAIKRTVSLPKWMDTEASAAGLSLSKVLQDALSQRLQ